MDVIAENLRYLLWREHPTAKRTRWAFRLSQLASCSEERANVLLFHGGLTAAELQRVAEVLQREEEDLVSTRLVEAEQVNILAENMRYLIGELERGGAASLAKALGVRASTVSPWADGKHGPNSKWLPEVANFFGIARVADLMEKPLFLSLEPVTVHRRRDWLKLQIDKLQPEDLRDLYPALRRLLGDER